VLRRLCSGQEFLYDSVCVSGGSHQSPRTRTATKESGVKVLISNDNSISVVILNDHPRASDERYLVPMLILARICISN